jgi:8-oxo-dGTP diphosphatase
VSISGEHPYPQFEADDCFSLTVVRHAGSIALGRKTRGYGVGRLVLPGGKDRFGPAGSLHENAAREVKEEIGVEAAVKQVGVLHISTEADIKKVSLFEAWTKLPYLHPSEELSSPQWYPKDALPYEDMPADYAIWLPHIIAGYSVTAMLETNQDVVIGGMVIRQQQEPLGRAEQVPLLSGMMTAYEQ